MKAEKLRSNRKSVLLIEYKCYHDLKGAVGFPEVRYILFLANISKLEFGLFYNPFENTKSIVKFYLLRQTRSIYAYYLL